MKAVFWALVSVATLMFSSMLALAYYCVLVPQGQWFHGADDVALLNFFLGVLFAFGAWSIWLFND